MSRFADRHLAAAAHLGEARCRTRSRSCPASKPSSCAAVAAPDRYPKSCVANQPSVIVQSGIAIAGIKARMQVGARGDRGDKLAAAHAAELLRERERDRIVAMLTWPPAPTSS